jgi:tRNA-uridine 2-sulfurtransferase
MNRKKVIVGMSGGVDSSAAVALLLRAGYDVSGVTLKLADPYIKDQGKQYRVIERAKKVCNHFGIEHIVADRTEKFRTCVVEQFADAYFSGSTPNPCVECNRHLKWDAILQIADEHDIPFIANGHYARIKKQGRSYRLLKGKDILKDQSYFLWRLDQKELSRTLFPLGDLTKKEVRAIAGDLNIPQDGNTESQDVCFIPDDDYKVFLKEFFPQRVADIGQGEFVDRSGNVLGYHNGFYRFTIGQRRGLGVAAGEPLYVLDIEPETNTVVLGRRMDTEDLGCIIGDTNWLNGSPPGEMTEAEVRVRYRGKGIACRIEPLENGDYHLMFLQPLLSVTPGQSAVLYDNETVIGGGIIRRKEKK